MISLLEWWVMLLSRGVLCELFDHRVEFLDGRFELFPFQLCDGSPADQVFHHSSCPFVLCDIPLTLCPQGLQIFEVLPATDEFCFYCGHRRVGLSRFVQCLCHTQQGLQARLPVWRFVPAPRLVWLSTHGCPC